MDMTVDLAAKGVDFAGSMAIRMFVAIARALGRRVERLALHSPQPAVAALFETVALGEVLVVAVDAADALERVRG